VGWIVATERDLPGYRQRGGLRGVRSGLRSASERAGTRTDSQIRNATERESLKTVSQPDKGFLIGAGKAVGHVRRNDD
jgi:hypothetical protein